MSKKNATGAGKGPQVVDLSQLPLQSLTQMKQELDSDIEYMSKSIHTLKVVMDKCLVSEDCLNKLGKEAEGREVLVPLTNSVYVPGKLVQADKAIVGIGTGYFVEKDVADAQDVFKRKEKLVEEQIEKVQKAAQDKVKLRDAVAEMMQEKLMLFIQQQQATAAASTSK